MIIQTIGIVGCGQMGSGIAEICALSGYEVIVYGRNEDVQPVGRGRVKPVSYTHLGGWKLVTPLPDPQRGHRDAGHARHNANVVDRLFADIPPADIPICV